MEPNNRITKIIFFILLNKKKIIFGFIFIFFGSQFYYQQIEFHGYKKYLKKGRKKIYLKRLK